MEEAIQNAVPTAAVQPDVVVFDDNVILMIFRFILYLMFALKLLEMCFSRRRKLRVNERIQRKFVFAHGIEMIRNFTPDDNALMELTLKNTLKNATDVFPSSGKPKPSPKERTVKFNTSANVYYDPLEFDDESMESSLRMSDKNIVEVEK